MKSLFALCLILIMASIMSASVPVKVGGEYSTGQPVTVLTAATDNPDGFMLTTLTFEWPEMPFAGYVPELGVALEQLPVNGYAEDMEHPPNFMVTSQQATLINYYIDTGPIASRTNKQELVANRKLKHLLPFRQGSNQWKPWS